MKKITKDWIYETIVNSGDKTTFFQSQPKANVAAEQIWIEVEKIQNELNAWRKTRATHGFNGKEII